MNSNSKYFGETFDTFIVNIVGNVDIIFNGGFLVKSNC